MSTSTISTIGACPVELRTERPARPPQMRQASVDDYGQIAALQVRNGFTIISYEDWMAFWRENPVYKQDRQCPIGWVLETESGEIVGYIGNIPLAYRFAGRELRAAAACSWVVDACYRGCGFGMRLMNRLMRQKDIDVFVFTTMNSVSEPLARSLGFSKVPVGTWNKKAFWITNCRGFSQSALKKKSVPFATVAGYPVGAALFCWNSLRDGMPVSSTSEIELCTDFDSRFDDFWEDLKYQNDNVLLADRTRETLQWHFRSALSRRRASILAVSKGSRLDAYAIFDRQDNHALGLRRVRFVDFQALNGSEDALRPALCWMLRKCREEGVHSLEVTGCWLDRPGLPQIRAPYHRTLSSWGYYYKATNRELSEQLKNPKVWAPSSFDGDSSL